MYQEIDVKRGRKNGGWPGRPGLTGPGPPEVQPWPKFIHSAIHVISSSSYIHTYIDFPLVALITKGAI